jgi:hypothetical protein
MARSFEASQAVFETFPIPDSEEEWKELRRPYYNASLAGCLFDEHEYVTLGDVCTEWLKPEEFDIVDEDRAKIFRRGIDMEPYIAMKAEEHLGLSLVRSPMYRRGVMMATPDYISEPHVADWGVEVKSTRTYLRGAIKRYWWWQCQAQNWSADWEMVHLFALDATLEVQHYEVWRDEDAIRMMMQRAEALVETLEWGELPAGVELSAGNVSHLWPKDSGAEHEVGGDIVPLVAQYLEAHENYKGWELEKERLKNRCVAELGPDSVATADGVALFTYKASKDVERVDWKTMIAENPDLAAKYTTVKPGPRVFRPDKRGVATMTRRMDGNEEF